MTLHWPQLTYLALLFAGLGLDLARHGKPKEGKYNFWWNLFLTPAFLYLLYCGGFFGGAR